MTDVGVGDCPDRADGLGHVFKSWRVDPRRSCEFCGRPGRDNFYLGESGGYFAEATGARTGVFSGLRAPMESGTGKSEKVQHSPEQDAKVAEIIAGKKRRDAEAVAGGSARPGQVAGAPKKGRS